ncbi:hypothetical protein [Kitasatospora sp. MY 5-36]|uniref:hypothetical protein n=1 Tax=Kitasatospora sp. MY 5-36 TaxID=1678027 RepID=UPI0018FEA839|nr:hypothetical protein [Kitasatospora sp. MY 5-36]
MTDKSDFSKPQETVDDAPSTEPQSTYLESHALALDVQHSADALLRLGASDPSLAAMLARLTEAVALEAARTARFSRALTKALADVSPPAPAGDRRPRASRRTRGIIDPFAVFAQSGEAGLRSHLGELDLDQLRDIVAEHGMDHDRLAMKWKDSHRVIDRIVERVEARTAKGSAFRGRTRRNPTPRDNRPTAPDTPAAQPE